MKNFTLLLIMLLASIALSAKNVGELQKKIQQKQEKFSVITQLNAKLNNLANSNGSKLVLKSAAATEKLDSTVNLILNPETQLWQKDYKDEYLYDAEMKNTAWIEKEWNLTSNSWDMISKTELGYDNSGRINSMLMYERDELTHLLKHNSKILVIYDSEGLQESVSMYSTEDEGVTWILDMKQIHHFNEAKQLLKTDVWSLDEDTDEFVLSMNIVNTYTASGKINTSSINVLFEGDDLLWSKTEYIYDGSGILTSIEYSMLNPMTFALEKSARITYQYNASGGRTVEINSTWNGTSWDDQDRKVYEYNPNGDVSVETESTWNGTAWIDERKDEYTFNSTSFSEVVYPQFEFILAVYSSFLNLFGIQESVDFTYNKVITGVNSFEMVDGSWKNTDKSTFYYSAATSTNINEFDNSVISVYPNPASESVNFSWRGNHESLSLQVYQITGTRVIEQTVNSGRPVTISHLQNGVYIYKLLNGQQNVKTGKMIKR